MTSMSGSGTIAKRCAPHAGHCSADAGPPDCLSVISRPRLQIAPDCYSSAGAWMRSSRGFPQPGTPQKTVRV